ncbi:hypothetical protein [Chryseobacterium sp. 'Rf worker isolate 10']|uniref:hypothetical protein n=1 Tax=Chryseobacterium sp. 'Rf worker isolate 10' TaxID=2887348 RepID=UPI003D6F860F
MIYIITNAKGFNESFEDFTRIHETRYQGFNEENSVIIKKVLDRIGKVIFNDEPLTKEESTELKQHLENRIQKLLSIRVSEPDIRTKIEFLGQTIGLNYTPFGRNDQDLLIDKFFRAYKICEECLENNKPIYLSTSEN